MIPSLPLQLPNLFLLEVRRLLFLRFVSIVEALHKLVVILIIFLLTRRLGHYLNDVLVT